ncbi:UNVERIFIED_CONTAM: hypothetical protein BEN50_13845 [Euhalothece sp. KZN 001]
MTQHNSAAFNRCLNSFLSMEAAASDVHQAISDSKSIASNLKDCIQTLHEDDRYLAEIKNDLDDIARQMK